MEEIRVLRARSEARPDETPPLDRTSAHAAVEVVENSAAWQNRRRIALLHLSPTYLQRSEQMVRTHEEIESNLASWVIPGTGSSSVQCAYASHGVSELDAFNLRRLTSSARAECQLCLQELQTSSLSGYIRQHIKD